MRAIAIISLIVLMTAITAVAEDKTGPTYRVGIEAGYVDLTKPTSEDFDNSLGYGLWLEYRLTKRIGFALPILYSAHDGINLPEGVSSDLTIMSVIPGFVFSNPTRIRPWLFVGIGASNLDGNLGYYDFVVDDSQICFSVNLRAGIDVDITKNIFAGANFGVTTTAVEFETLNGNKEWDNVGYMTMLGRVGYSF